MGGMRFARARFRALTRHIQSKGLPPAGAWREQRRSLSSVCVDTRPHIGQTIPAKRVFVSGFATSIDEIEATECLWSKFTAQTRSSLAREQAPPHPSTWAGPVMVARSITLIAMPLVITRSAWKPGSDSDTRRMSTAALLERNSSGDELSDQVLILSGAVSKQASSQTC
jgi:hypothetical protein